MKSDNKLTFSNFSFTKISDQSYGKILNGKKLFFNLLDWTNQDKFAQILSLQKEVWGLDDLSLVPKNILSIASDTGGLIVLLENELRQALGFALCLGTTNKSWLLHMIGITSDQRFTNLGFNLSIFVALKAQEKNIDQIIWTFDPLRGSNANLNFAKLGVISDTYLVDKYGQTSSTLYGKIPSDRLLVRWNINDPQVIKRLLDTENLNLATKKIANIPIVSDLDLSLLNQITKNKKLLVKIPTDIDQLSEIDKANWRQKLRQTLLTLLPTSQNNANDNQNYQITNFLSLKDEEEKRQNYYLLTRKE